MRFSPARCLMVVFIALIMVTPSVAAAGASEDKKLPNQNMFNITIALQIQPAKVGNNTTWLGKFEVRATLISPKYRRYLDELAANNTTEANNLFWELVNATLYTSLLNDISEKFSAAGIRPVLVLPENGAIHLTENWTALVDIGVTDILISRNYLLTMPIYGPISLRIGNKTYAYNWKRFIVILPKDYSVKSFQPSPVSVEKNVAIWENGDYIPRVELYTAAYSFARFLNETRGKRVLHLHYTPVDGHLYFEAVFPGTGDSTAVEGILRYLFGRALNPISMQVITANGTVRVVGVSILPTKEDSRFYTVWKVYVPLPVPFSKVEVSGGSYKMLGNSAVVITVKEQKTRTILLYVLGGVLVVAAVAWYITKGRKPSPEGETDESGEKQEGTPESEKDVEMSADGEVDE